MRHCAHIVLPPNCSITVFIRAAHTLMKTGTAGIAFYSTLPVLVICSFTASCGVTDADYLSLKVRQYLKADILSRWVATWSMNLTNQDVEGKTKNTFLDLSCMVSHVCMWKKDESAHLSLESRYHCRCRRFSACWSSPSEPWSAGGWRCLGGWCPHPPRGCSPDWSVHPFEPQGSTFKVKNITN